MNAKDRARAGGETAVAVLFLDLDGTVREGKDDALGRFVNGPDDVRVFPEAVKRMREWKAAGGRIVAVSNQGGIALGHMTMESLKAAVMETQRQCEGLFDVVHVCQHHPDAKDPEMARCWCRKPSAGAVAEAVHALYRRTRGEYYPPHMALFVGDRPEDRDCAANASIDFMDAKDWRVAALLGAR